MPKRILVIDDDEDLLEILNIIFQDEGFEVILSNTGEAVDHLSVIHPDLVLADVRIASSGRNGGDICSRIKAEHKDEKLPVILLSAEEDLHQIARNCGADSFIRKPFDIYQLLKQVNELIL
jgi:DNA-binding response OmpR family regulator